MTAKAKPKAERQSAGAASTNALDFELPTGGKPWTEAEDIREKRRQRALARKAIRAAKRAEQTEEG